MARPTQMERKAWIASAVAALATVVLLRAYLHRLEFEATGGPERSVVVLARDLERGAALDRDALATRALPESYVESRHVGAGDLDRMIGLSLAVRGRAGEALLWTDLSSLRREQPSLSSLVPPGMRAMTLKPLAGTGESLIEPGDRVDVLSTRSQAAEDDAATRFVAQSLLVLATGSAARRDGARSSEGARGGVTVAVDAEQGRALAEAELTGTLRLVVRNADELALEPDPNPTTELIAPSGRGAIP